MSVWPDPSRLEMSIESKAMSPAARSRQGRSLWPSKSMPESWIFRARSETGGGSSARTGRRAGRSRSPRKAAMRGRGMEWGLS